MSDRLIARLVQRMIHERRMRRRAERLAHRLWASKRVRSAWSMDEFERALKDGSLKRMLAEHAAKAAGPATEQGGQAATKKENADA